MSDTNPPDTGVPTMKANIFQSEIIEDTIEVVKQTMSVKRDDNGEAVISFATNRGKGSGAQAMRVSDFESYVSTLEEIAEYGIEETPESDLSPSEMVRETIRNVDGVISCRVRGGKGAKPAKVPASQFDDLVALLRSTVPLVEQAAEQVSALDPTDDGDDEI